MWNMKGADKWEKRDNIEGQRLCVQAPIEGVCVPASAGPAGSLLVFVSARRHVGASTESKRTESLGARAKHWA